MMGAGTNRMNKYTVGKATKRLGDYLLATTDRNFVTRMVWLLDMTHGTIVSISHGLLQMYLAVWASASIFMHMRNRLRNLTFSKTLEYFSWRGRYG